MRSLDPRPKTFSYKNRFGYAIRMTQPNAPKPRRYLRTRADYRWTGPKIAQFFRTLSETGSVTKAARAVGMSRQSAYNLRGRMFRDHGPTFGRLWDHAMAIATSRRVEAALDRMAADKARAAERRAARAAERRAARAGSRRVPDPAQGDKPYYFPRTPSL